MKIIKILPHEPHNLLFSGTYFSQFPDTDILPIEKAPYKIGFFNLDWHHRWGKYVPMLNPEINVECWRPYGDSIDQIYCKEVEGIVHRVFPSHTATIKKLGTLVRSPLMLELLKKELQDSRTIVHFYGSHDSLVTWLLNKLGKGKKNIILQHLGGWFSYFDFRYKKNPLKLLPYAFEKRILSTISLYLTASKVEEHFLKANFPQLYVHFFLNGIDFKENQLLNKAEVRKQLNIGLEKKVLLYIGRYYDTKSVKQIIEMFVRLKNQDPAIDLFLVGGYKTDPYYQLGIDSGAHVVLRQDKPITPYIAAADAYILPVYNPLVRDFGGIGIASIEALAQNTPVVGHNIIHVNNSAAIPRLGTVLKGRETLDQKVLEILGKKYDTRALVEKEFDVLKNTERLINFYEKILQNND